MPRGLRYWETSMNFERRNTWMEYSSTDVNQHAQEILIRDSGLPTHCV